VIVVTGGANGIGRALAQAVAGVGATVHVLDVAEAEGLPAAITPHRVDVSDRDQVLAAAEQILGRHGQVDGLVCGAAIQPRTPVLQTDPAEWRRVQAVNLDGVVWACQAFVPAMVRRRSGSVVVFTSGIAQSGYPQAAAYTSTKGALLGFARSLAAEVADARVRVNIVAPGVVDTPQMRAANQGADFEHWAATTGIGTPDDVVGPLLFLLSDAATMTGSLLTRERRYGRTP
jgi:3-oxoacyl-[acyl-carrier protein] reductase